MSGLNLSEIILLVRKISKFSFQKVIYIKIS